MPSKSKKQMKFIYAMRKKYGSKKNAPQNKKWVFDSEWTSGVDMDKLPTRVLGFKSFTESKWNIPDNKFRYTEIKDCFVDLEDDGFDINVRVTDIDEISAYIRKPGYQDFLVEDLVETLLFAIPYLEEKGIKFIYGATRFSLSTSPHNIIFKNIDQLKRIKLEPIEIRLIFKPDIK